MVATENPAARASAEADRLVDGGPVSIKTRGLRQTNWRELRRRRLVEAIFRHGGCQLFLELAIIDGDSLPPFPPPRLVVSADGTP
jgi:hypothetical protein